MNLRELAARYVAIMPERDESVLDPIRGPPARYDVGEARDGFASALLGTPEEVLARLIASGAVPEETVRAAFTPCLCGHPATGLCVNHDCAGLVCGACRSAVGECSDCVRWDAGERPTEDA